MKLLKLGLYTALVSPVFLASGALAQVDEVVTTAQRRVENVQDVPISISTLDEETLTAIFQGGEDIRALSGRIPGLNAESSNGRVAPRFYIRGLGNTDFDLAASQPVSVIMDDVVMENVVLKSFPIFDVERVEVLRGPQGTLFGRNTPAGIVKFDSVKPSQETSGFLAVSAGSLGSVKTEAALGGALDDDLSARVSVSYNHRSDWIDNDFTGIDDAFGGFDDIAGRAQIRYQPNDSIDVIANIHGRDIDGTASMFRANVFNPGSNNLNANSDRDSVFYDGGDGNKQHYATFGGSLNGSFDFGDITLTTISGFETANGSSRGDIDGGSGAVFLPGGSFPGPIAFPADTLDGIDELEQFTQEVRLSSDAGPVSWQAGIFYFDSDLLISTNPFFAPPTTVQHKNESISIFGHASYEFGDGFEAAGGLRYTDDKKSFAAPVANFPVAPVKVDAGEISFDASLTKSLNDNTNVYARVARGFRAPSIQGRDVAFFGNPSTAASEIIHSFEVGVKTDINDMTRLNATAFYYDANDLQFSAIGGGGNFNQLVNADGRGLGFEADLIFQPNDNTTITAGGSYADTKITEDGLMVAPCGGGCTVTDPVDVNGLASIEGNPFPQAPELTFNMTARLSTPFHNGELYAFTDWNYIGQTNFFLYESAEFNSDSSIEGGLRVGYGFGDGAYDLSLYARNITNEKTAKGAIDFNNLTAYLNDPRVFGVAARANF